MATAATNVAVVINNGSCNTQAGLAGITKPNIVFPSIVGHPPSHLSALNSSIEVGHKAEAKQNTLLVKHPIEHCIITNWDDMLKLWQYTFDQLDINPKEHPVLLTEPPCNPKINREKMTQIMFETFNVPALFIANNTVLSLFASGLRTGIVIESGNNVSYAVPIYEGHPLPHAIGHIGLGGQDATDTLLMMLNEKRRCSFNTLEDRDLVNEMKENFAYVTQDYEKENSNVTSFRQEYCLPNGQVIDISNLQFHCTEIFFQPLLNQRQSSSIQEITKYSIEKCDSELHSELYRNVLLSGGNTMFPGFPERLKKEIIALVPTDTKVKVIAPPNCKYSLWIGGSILAALPSFQQLYINKEEYDEFGPSIVHMKCF